MNDAALVGGGKSRANLARDLGGFVGRKPADAPDDGGEGFAVDILHGKKLHTVGFDDIEHAANAWMGNLARDANFRMEARECSRILREAFGKKLDGHQLTERQVLRAVDFAHAAAASHGDDTIALGNHLSGSEASAPHGVGTG